MNEKRKYALSDLTLIFPDMRDDEFASFKDDIEETGQREPVYIFDGKVIDGRHRLRACEELNIEPWYEVLPDGHRPRPVCQVEESDEKKSIPEPEGAGHRAVDGAAQAGPSSERFGKFGNFAGFRPTRPERGCSGGGGGPAPYQ